MSVTNTIITTLTDRLCLDKDTQLTSKLNEDLSLDSLDIVELAMVLEDKFDIEILDETLKDWKAVEDIVVTVSFLEGEKNGP